MRSKVVFVLGKTLGSALIRPAKHAAALIADKVAKSCSFWLLLATLTLLFLDELQASNEPVVDDDDISLPAAGTFELLTKEAIPRVIIVDNPSETIVLRMIGSTIRADKVTNNPERLAELEAASQEAHAILKGKGSPTVAAVRLASAFAEAPDAGAQRLSQSGTVSFRDIDANDVVVIASSYKGDIVWTGGQLTAAQIAALTAGTFTASAAATGAGTTSWTFLKAGESIAHTVTATHSASATAAVAGESIAHTVTATHSASATAAVRRREHRAHGHGDAQRQRDGRRHGDDHHHRRQ